MIVNTRWAPEDVVLVAAQRDEDSEHETGQQSHARGVWDMSEVLDHESQGENESRDRESLGVAKSSEHLPRV